MTTAHVRSIRRTLLGWYRSHGRDSPWRHTHDPYAVLVSEIMLQQQTVARVVPVYRTFLERFPDVASLARAPRSDVVRVWSAIGLNRQALRLQEIARDTVACHGGRLPADAARLRRFKGVGRYTAAAVLCFAFGRREPIVDTNIRRVLSRLLSGPATGALLSEQAAWEMAATLLPRGRQDVYDWNQALMDLGATICTARAPKCGTCPVRKWCGSSGAQRTAVPLKSSSPPSRRTRPEDVGAPRIAESRAPYGELPKKPRRHVGSSRWLRGQVVRVLARQAPGEALPIGALARSVEPPLGPDQLPLLLDVLEALGKAGIVSATVDARGETVCALSEG